MWSHLDIQRLFRAAWYSFCFILYDSLICFHRASQTIGTIAHIASKIATARNEIALLQVATVFVDELKTFSVKELCTNSRIRQFRTSRRTHNFHYKHSTRRRLNRLVAKSGRTCRLGGCTKPLFRMCLHADTPRRPGVRLGLDCRQPRLPHLVLRGVVVSSCVFCFLFFVYWRFTSKSNLENRYHRQCDGYSRPKQRPAGPSPSCHRQLGVTSRRKTAMRTTSPLGKDVGCCLPTPTRREPISEPSPRRTEAR